jgi:hypothetical protein
VLQRTDAAENLLEFTDLAEAEEWRASLSIAAQTAAVVN